MVTIYICLPTICRVFQFRWVFLSSFLRGKSLLSLASLSLPRSLLGNFLHEARALFGRCSYSVGYLAILHCQSRGQGKKESRRLSLGAKRVESSGCGKGVLPACRSGLFYGQMCVFLAARIQLNFDCPTSKSQPPLPLLSPAPRRCTVSFLRISAFPKCVAPSASSVGRSAQCDNFRLQLSPQKNKNSPKIVCKI